MALRRRFAFPANRISLIVNEKRSVTADTALRLARFFGTSAEYWRVFRTGTISRAWIVTEFSAKFCRASGPSCRDLHWG